LPGTSSGSGSLECAVSYSSTLRPMVVGCMNLCWKRLSGRACPLDPQKDDKLARSCWFPCYVPGASSGWAWINVILIGVDEPADTAANFGGRSRYNTCLPSRAGCAPVFGLNQGENKQADRKTRNTCLTCLPTIVLSVLGTKQGRRAAWLSTCMGCKWSRECIDRSNSSSYRPTHQGQRCSRVGPTIPDTGYTPCTRVCGPPGGTRTTA